MFQFNLNNSPRKINFVQKNKIKIYFIKNAFLMRVLRVKFYCNAMNFFVIEHLLHSTANANDDEHIKTRPLKITIITKETSVVFFLFFLI